MGNFPDFWTWEGTSKNENTIVELSERHLGECRGLGWGKRVLKSVFVTSD